MKPYMSQHTFSISYKRNYEKLYFKISFVVIQVIFIV